MDAAPFHLEITTDAPAAFHAPSCSGSLDLRLGDCMDVMQTFPDGYFDLAIVDPPYGIGMGGGADWGTNTRTKHEKKTWDTEPPPAEYFEELRRVSKHQIIWGGNYFLDHLTSTKCFVVWDKMNGGNNMADCELAWTSFDSPVRKHTRHIFSGIGNTNYTSIHPTQKPVGLYDWLFSKYAKAGMRVLDTHMGSGSIAIAAHYAGIHLTACEIDADYFHAAKARIARETSQAELFSPQNAPLTRSELLSRGKCCDSGCINCPYTLDAPQAAKNAATVPIRSGPCRVLWLSHDWSGPRGQCGRCGQERG